MSRDRKTSYQWYMAWEYDVEEAVLDTKSRQGWQLEKGGCFHSVFVKDDSIVYRHRLDYNPEAMKDPQEKARYVAAFEDGGWEFVNSTFNGWIYLRKPYHEGMPEEEFEIYSDRESMMGMYDRFSKLGQILSVMMIMVIIYDLSIALAGGGAAGIFCAVIMALLLWWLRRGMRMMKYKQEMLLGKHES